MQAQVTRCSPGPEPVTTMNAVDVVDRRSDGLAGQDLDAQHREPDSEPAAPSPHAGSCRRRSRAHRLLSIPRLLCPDWLFGAHRHRRADARLGFDAPPFGQTIDKIARLRMLGGGQGMAADRANRLPTTVVGKFRGRPPTASDPAHRSTTRSVARLGCRSHPLRTSPRLAPAVLPRVTTDRCPEWRIDGSHAAALANRCAVTWRAAAGAFEAPAM
jgi:hypothetical protein